MFAKKKGIPEIGELVICTVKRILYHSVFVTIDEYVNKEGMVHISEIAPGRIRNLRDYVSEGKKIICKVININKLTNNIDLSLRRVSTGQRVTKLQEAKQEEKAEKLLEQVGKEFKLTPAQVHERIGNKILEQYGSLYTFFQHLLEKDTTIMDGIDAPKELKDALAKAVKEKIKNPEIKISGTLTLKSYASNGINDIKKVLADIEKRGVSVNYLGAPKYQINITSQDYKSAEKLLQNIIEDGLKLAKKHNIEGAFLKSAS